MSQVAAIEPLRPLPEHGRLHLVTANDGTVLTVLDVAPPQAHTTVQIVHGFTGSKEDFWDVAGLLGQRGYRVIAHDHRGQCQSGHAHPATYTLAQLARDTLVVADVLDADRPHLLGHSFGGLVAREAVLVDSTRWSSLTMFCSGPAAIGPFAADLTRIIDILSHTTMPAAWDWFLMHADEPVPITADPNPQSVYTRRWLRSDPASVIAQATILLETGDRTEELTHSGVRAQVVFGELDDAWPIDEQVAMATTLGVVPTVLPGLGHCANEEDPQAVADALALLWLPRP